MTDLICDCGKEPTLHIDMSRGPGMMCQVKCECGQCGNEVWDVRLPWPDIKADWDHPYEREARKAVNDGLLVRTARGYLLTEKGNELVSLRMAGGSSTQH